jgi:hypothetical protein
MMMTLRTAAAAAAFLALPWTVQAADLSARRAPSAVVAAPVVLPSRTVGFAAAVPETYIRAGCPTGPLTEAGAARVPNDDCLPPRLLPVNHTRYISWVPVLVRAEQR